MIKAKVSHLLIENIVVFILPCSDCSASCRLCHLESTNRTEMEGFRINSLTDSLITFLPNIPSHH